MLFLVALVVGGYILSNQRLYLPTWVPIVGSDFVDRKFELVDRAVAHAGPGPGGRHRRRQGRRDQQGRAAGRPRASSRVKIQRKYSKRIIARRVGAHAPEDRPERHDDPARPGLARPRAAPEDCIDPGQPDAAQRQRRRDPRGARRRHARLPAHAARRRRPRACRTTRASCRNTFRRFEPTGRDLAKLTSLLTERRQQHPPLDPQLPPAHRGGGREGRRSSPRSSTPPTPSSRPSPARTAALRATLRQLPDTLAVDAHRPDQGRPPGPRARPDARRALRPVRARARAVAGARRGRS